VFDGDTVHTVTNVMVQNGVISALGPAVGTKDIPVINCDGYTLIPGLIDAHAHTEFVDQLRESLRFGITTVLDMGTFPEYDQMLRKAAASQTDVADFRSSGIFITAPGGHGTEYGHDIPTLADADHAEAFVNDRRRDGADYLKVVLNGVRHESSGMPTLDSATVRAIVDAGHALDLTVIAHVESVDDVRLAATTGVDGLAHHWRDSGARPELAKLLATRNMFVMPTLTAIDGFLGEGPAQLLSDALISPYLSDLSRRELSKDLTIPQGMTMKQHVDGMCSLIEADVLLLAGSDAFTGNPRIVHGASLHRMLELFVDAGLTPEEALQSATANVADAFDLSDRGRIKPGLRADLVLVTGDPTIDILATRDIIRIWRGGVEFVRRPVDNSTKPKDFASLLKDITPLNWILYDKVKYFTAENLYEQINGRAEYFISYDVTRLTFASFEKKSDSNSFINVSIYDMKTPLNAFGVFSGERSMEAERLELGRDAYGSGANYYIWHGRYYIQLVAFNMSEELKTVGGEIAQQIVDKLEDSGEPVWGLTALPKENRIPQSIQYFKVDAFGLDFMGDTYTAKYSRGETVLSVFLSRNTSKTMAQSRLDKFTTYANKYGKGIESIDRENVNLVSCDMGGTYDVVFCKGDLIAGVTGAKDEQDAIKAAIDLWRQL
jgi:imidazolonepropionase-like amidohydrolase